MIDIEEYQTKHCKWSLTKNGIKNPHLTSSWKPPKNIYDDAVDMIGNSPLIKMKNMCKKEGIKCEVLAKCESFMPGGSLKDRVGKRTVHDLEKLGKIKPGYTLIEATSGNCGIGLALLGAVKGYEVIITMPDKMSLEKSYVLSGFGAHTIRTPTDAPFNTKESHIGVAKTLNSEIETSLFLDQYSDEYNALVHYDETAEELWYQCDGKIDYVVMTCGTGGTITGIGRKLKERNPDIKIIGVDPHGSVMALPEELNKKMCPFQVEGIGYDFVPKNLDQNVVDKWYKSDDKESFQMVRRIIREEGLLVGGSSGSAMVAALDVARNLPADKRVVVIFVDSIRNYMSKFLNDDWMIENGFYDEYDIEKHQESARFLGLNPLFGVDYKIADLKLPQSDLFEDSTPISVIVDYLREKELNYVPITKGGQYVGIASLDYITNKLITYKANLNEAVRRVLVTDVKKLHFGEPLSRVSRGLKKHNFVLVYDDMRGYYVCQPNHLTEFFLNISKGHLIKENSDKNKRNHYSANGTKSNSVSPSKRPKIKI